MFVAGDDGGRDWHIVFPSFTTEKGFRASPFLTWGPPRCPRLQASQGTSSLKVLANTVPYLPYTAGPPTDVYLIVSSTVKTIRTQSLPVQDIRTLILLPYLPYYLRYPVVR